MAKKKSLKERLKTMTPDELRNARRATARFDEQHAEPHRRKFDKDYLEPDPAAEEASAGPIVPSDDASNN